MEANDLSWRLLSASELEQLYLRHMRRDFPPRELKPLSAILNSVRDNVAHVWGVFSGGELAAYLYMVRPAGCDVSQLDYFAVLPERRSAGLGAQLLAALPEHESGARAILIEAENPDDAPDSVMARRRLNFYHRCGAVDTGWLEHLYDAWFCVMVLQCGEAPVDTEYAMAALGACYRRALGREWRKYARFYAPGERTRELKKED